MTEEVRVTVIATGFDERKEKVELPQIKKWAGKRGQRNKRTEGAREVSETRELRRTRCSRLR